ncbi:hypothetical protein VNO77_26999 [Canavalia gladiata]|uniref:Uncharacterized protein n=1 Tax=Canavalia gladiata TaxID=3824 RepID=A0AAN9Q634_CANGL
MEGLTSTSLDSDEPPSATIVTLLDEGSMCDITARWHHIFIPELFVRSMRSDSRNLKPITPETCKSLQKRNTIVTINLSAVKDTYRIAKFGQWTTPSSEARLINSWEENQQLVCSCHSCCCCCFQLWQPPNLTSFGPTRSTIKPEPIQKLMVLNYFTHFQREGAKIVSEAWGKTEIDWLCLARDQSACYFHGERSLVDVTLIGYKSFFCYKARSICVSVAPRALALQSELILTELVPHKVIKTTSTAGYGVFQKVHPRSWPRDPTIGNANGRSDDSPNLATGSIHLEQILSPPVECKCHVDLGSMIGCVWRARMYHCLV